MKSAVGSLAVASLFGGSKGWSRQINVGVGYKIKVVGKKTTGLKCYNIRLDRLHLVFDVRPANGEAWLVNAVDHFHPGGGQGV